jgi:hypothetical protein
MPKKTLKVMCVHGVGHHPVGGQWETRWKNAILKSVADIDPDRDAELIFIHYDDIFKKHPITFSGCIEALAKLTVSGASHLFRAPRSISGNLRWTAGMVVQWVENDNLRRETRKRVEAVIAANDPDVICAHSLGSMIFYDAFLLEPALVEGRIFISFGSQIANPFVVGNLSAGRVSPLPEARFWYHLYNSEDAVFTAPIRIEAANFLQEETEFDIQGIADHDAEEYLGHGKTREIVWTNILLERYQPRLFRVTRIPRSVAKPERRALLVGINEYPDESMCLEGCVNDVFLVSALLQESGFEAEDIRVVLDKRATARGIIDRLDWLLDGAREKDTRIFYYSGHGAQIPGYGSGDQVDRMDESLVPYDFDWSDERAVTDDRLYALYSQLPYGLNFMMMFDCCHSGGLTRDGSSRIRGVNPPDDIRHRRIRWNVKHGMWVERDLKSPNKEMSTYFNRQIPVATHKIGQALTLRPLAQRTYNRVRKSQGHHGPYMPLLVYACRESEYSYEYRHGTIAYGAFTYSLDRALRLARTKKKDLSFAALLKSVGKTLSELNYEQTPQLVGPAALKKSPVPILAKA